MVPILSKLMLKNKAEVPRISKILATLDPIILPVIASVAGIAFVAANRVITISGADVPKATIVKPINTGDNLNFLAIVPAAWPQFTHSRKALLRLFLLG